ncbi:hypothetical protein HDU77_007187 [Chytriomyces hyalinus]|nr:hypothetical protein HDU77_007187 [Chytriomyces hyalinus]
MYLDNPNVAFGIWAWFAFWAMSMVLFIARRKKTVIKVRGLMLTATQSIATAVAVLAVMIRYILAEILPCFLIAWTINLAIVVWTTSICLRIIYLYINHRYNQNLLFNESVDLERPGAVSLGTVDEFGYPSKVEEANNRTRASVNQKAETSKEATQPDGVNHGLKQWFVRKTDSWVIEKGLYRRIRKVVLVWYIFTVVYCAIAQGLTKKLRLYPMDFSCKFEIVFYGLVVFSVLFLFIVVGIFSTWLISDIRDHSFIAKELIITYLIGTPNAILYLLFHEIQSLRDVVFDSAWLIVISLMTSHITSIVIPIILTYIEDYKTSRVTIDLNLVSFQKALGDRALFQEIKDFSIRDMCGENFYFLEALKELKFEAATLVLKHERKASETSRLPSLSVNMLKVNPYDMMHRKKSLSIIEDASAIVEDEHNISEPRARSAEESGSGLSPEPNANTDSRASHLSINRIKTRAESNSCLKPAARLSIEARTSGQSHTEYLRPRESSTIVRIGFLGTESVTDDEWDAINAKVVPTELVFKYIQFYNIYCRRGGQMEVNLSGDTKCKLEDIAAAGEWKIGDFDLARDEIMNVLFTNVYCRWAFQKKEEKAESSFVK